MRRAEERSDDCYRELRSETIGVNSLFSLFTRVHFSLCVDLGEGLGVYSAAPNLGSGRDVRVFGSSSLHKVEVSVLPSTSVQ